MPARTRSQSKMVSHHTHTTTSSLNTTTSTTSAVQSVFSDASIDQLFALFRQEETCYQTSDYLTFGKCELVVSQEEYEQQYPDRTSPNDEPFRKCGDGSLLMRWRQATCVWAFQVGSYFGLDREVVTIAMNHFDRYLATVLMSMSSKNASNHNNNDSTITTDATDTTTIQDEDDKTTTISKPDFQLWVLTALYLAVKLNHGCCLEEDRLYFEDTDSTLEVICLLRDPQPIDPQVMAQMELQMLHALDWQVHPPTPQAMVRLLWNPQMAKHLLQMVHSHNDDSNNWNNASSKSRLLENAAQWWHLQVYEHCCDILDKILEDYEMNQLFSCSQLAIVALLYAVDSCDFGQNCNTTTPSRWLLQQWKLFLPPKCHAKFSNLDDCHEQLEDYLLQLQQEEEEEELNAKKRRHSVGSCEDQQVDLEIVSPPATKKTKRIQVVPSPACVRETIVM